MKLSRIITAGHSWQWWLLYGSIATAGWFLANALFGWEEHGWFWLAWGIVLVVAMTTAGWMEAKYWKAGKR